MESILKFEWKVDNALILSGVISAGLLVLAAEKGVQIVPVPYWDFVALGLTLAAVFSSIRSIKRVRGAFRWLLVIILVFVSFVFLLFALSVVGQIGS